MDQKQWNKLSQVEKLRYAINNKDSFTLIVDNNTIQIESEYIEDFTDYHIDDLLRALDIPYEVA